MFGKNTTIQVFPISTPFFRFFGRHRKAVPSKSDTHGVGFAPHFSPGAGFPFSIKIIMHPGFFVKKHCDLWQALYISKGHPITDVLGHFGTF